MGINWFYGRERVKEKLAHVFNIRWEIIMVSCGQFGGFINTLCLRLLWPSLSSVMYTAMFSLPNNYGKWLENIILHYKYYIWGSCGLGDRVGSPLIGIQFDTHILHSACWSGLGKILKPKLHQWCVSVHIRSWWAGLYHSVWMCVWMAEYWYVLLSGLSGRKISLLLLFTIQNCSDFVNWRWYGLLILCLKCKI